MFLFIFESIGTSELLLVGIVALIFLGPRKMPEMAKKIGKMMAEFRGSANEFKETWQREINFSDELKALDINNIEDEIASEKVISVEPIPKDEPSVSLASPAIKAADPASFEHLLPKESDSAEMDSEADSEEKVLDNDKKSWL